MSTKSKIQNRRSPSPLMGRVSNRTEARRSRSRSRARIESQLVRRVEQIPVIQSTFEYLLSTYSIIKESNPFFKENLQRTEDMAFWLKQKTDDFITMTRLKEPLKRLDAAAAIGMDNFEKTRLRMKMHLEMSQRDWVEKFRDAGFEMRRISTNVHYAVLETLQTSLDYIEESFESVMLPPTKESAKYSQHLGVAETFGRIFDMTYRLQVGIINFVFEKLRQFSDIKVWQAALSKYFDPTHIRNRAAIIRQEIRAPVGRKLNYMENKELTEIDRQMIVTGRILMKAQQKMTEFVRAGPQKMVDIGKNYFEYIRSLLRQLSEVSSFQDLLGIGFHETRLSLEMIQSRIEYLKNSNTYSNLLDWLAYQEKSLTKT